jgi:hypothetical protein
MRSTRRHLARAAAALLGVTTGFPGLALASYTVLAARGVATGRIPAAMTIPYARTPVDGLSNRYLRHREVLLIARDFGDPGWEIAIDGWIPQDGPRELSEVRLWWVKRSGGDERHPFSKGELARFGIDFDHPSPASWRVHLSGDKKEFSFEVELDPSGRALAYANVDLEDGGRIERCRAVSSRLHARRFLGIPIGIRALGVTCIDALGRWRQGRVPYRKLRKR